MKRPANTMDVRMCTSLSVWKGHYGAPMGRSTIRSMLSVALLRERYQHMEWADALVWSAGMASDAASADPAMLDKLRHLHGTQQYFLKVWRAEELTYDKTNSTPEEELALAHSWHGEARALLEELDD